MGFIFFFKGAIFWSDNTLCLTKAHKRAFKYYEILSNKFLILTNSITRCASQYSNQNNKSIMNKQPRIDIQAVIGSQINMRPYSNKAIFPTKNDLKNIDNELEKRKRQALAVVRENKLKDGSSRAELFEQQRRNAKYFIFQKYVQVIEKELGILKIEMINQDEYYDADYEYFTISYRTYTNNLERLISFEGNLQALRSSTCFFKYCCPKQPRCCCCIQWFCCWWTLPFYCCHRRGLKQSKSHTKLQELYERYEQLMVAENQAVACPHQ